VEQGLLDLDEPVGARLPALATPRVLTGFDSAGAPVTSPAKSPITLRRLLSHTSGLAYDFNSAALGRYLEATGGTLMGGGEPDIPLMFEPGEAWLYGIGIDWAGRLIEAAAGKPLDEVVGELVLKPLGMGDTTYFPNASEAARKAGVQQKLDDGTLLASAFGLPPVRHFMMGGGGLYSTAPDYLKFLAMILQRGAPLLRRETFDEMMRDQTGGLDAGSLTTAQPALSRDFTPLPGLTRRHGLAGLVNIDPVPGGRSAHSLTWAGLANCYYWADPDAGAAGVVMAQVLPFADPALLETFAAVERAVYA
jgi:CubicO group peptidase (beta-lactamase class C family)